MKAYRIELRGWKGYKIIYAGENAEQAKWDVIRDLRNAEYDTDFADIIGCKRAPNYDFRATKRGLIYGEEDRE